LNFDQIPEGIKLPSEDGNSESIDVVKVSEASINLLEQAGFTNITVKREKFTTPNGAEGLKTQGTLNVVVPETKKQIDAEYVLFHFNSQNVIQEIIITWPQDDNYAEDIVKRIIDSVELKSEETEQEKE